MSESIYYLPARSHTCDVCGKRDIWTDDWMQWGNLLASDYGHQIETCSPKCRTNLDPEKKWKDKYGVASDSRQYKYP